MAYELDELAQIVGVKLKSIPNLGSLTEINTEIGALVRLNHLVNVATSPDYQHKKHVYTGSLSKDSRALPIIVIHYSGSVYGRDPEYFTRWYQDGKELFGGEVVVAKGSKLFPHLYSFDDETTTLVVERAKSDLQELYLNPNSTPAEALDAANKIVETFMLGSKDGDRKEGFPRYIEAFLDPEYEYLRTSRFQDYYRDQDLIAYHNQTQEKLKAYTDELTKKSFTRGFGIPDCTPANLVEDNKGNIMYIDIERYAFTYHWLSLLGNVYQHAFDGNSQAEFTKALKAIALRSIAEYGDPELATQLFVLGRLNSILIPATIRNIAFMAEIKQPIPEVVIRKTLDETNHLLQLDDDQLITGID